MRKRYKDTTCGPTSIAAILQKPVKEVISHWVDKNGYRANFTRGTNAKELIANLKALGYSTKVIKYHRYKKGMGGGEFPLPKTELAIARIQWLCPEHKRRARMSHFVALIREEHYLAVFCNGLGYWFQAFAESGGKRYLEHGYVTSFIEITPPTLKDLGYSEEESEALRRQILQRR